MGNNCPEYVNELNDFLDGTLDDDLCAEIQKHLGECKNCRIMVDTLQQTVKLCRDGKPEPLPEELKSRLDGLLKGHWNKKFGERG